MSSEKTALYRFFNAEEELLYVGIAADPAHRWKEHRRSKPWAREVTIRVIEWLSSREEASAAEVRAIHIEKPRYNIRDSPHKLPPDLPRPSMRRLSASEAYKAVGYIAIQDIAAMLGVKPVSISGYRYASKPGRHYADRPFPAHDEMIAFHPVWRIEREDEIRRWFAALRRPRRGAGGGQPSHARNVKPEATQEDTP